ncbi:MAG: tRNA (adenosine(37)-N6)-dimethylallyltransferase MiaA, partial [Clostridia bacterium]|nr:tRNA (adenosine(37)-N6)-dimethylallyltransferase MiaA [Clostridia bacterium]
MKPVVVCGPTASGKTALAIALAQRLNGEIVSADSMQIYRGMDIGTAKPDEDERAAAMHHMIDIADPGEVFSAARYSQQASVIVDDIIA